MAIAELGDSATRVITTAPGSTASCTNGSRLPRSPPSAAFGSGQPHGTSAPMTTSAFFPTTRLNPTDKGFEPTPSRPDHRTSKLVQPRPCGSIAAQAEDSLRPSALAPFFWLTVGRSPTTCAYPGRACRRSDVWCQLPQSRAPARCTTPGFPRRWDTRIPYIDPR